MSFFSRTRSPEQSEARSVRLPSYLFADHYGQSSGVTVNQDTALRSSTVWACIRLLAGTGSMLPVDVVRYGANGSRNPVTPTPQIVAAPSLWVPGSGWRYQAIASWLTDGNLYARVTETDPSATYVRRAELLSPSSVTWRALDGMLTPFIGGKAQTLWPVGDLWHVPAYLAPGSPVGLSPVEYGAESIGLSIAARKFGAQFFGDGGVPSAILAPERDPGEEGAKSIKDAWRRATSGNREPAVLPQSIKYERISVAPDESQFLESQRFSVEDICRFFGVPPEMIGGASSGSSVTYANREQRAVDFLTFGLDPWLTRLEEMLTNQLPRPQVARINRAAVLRSDTLTRYQAHQIAMRNGWRSVNETRQIEDEPPIGPEGDTYEAGAEVPAIPTPGGTP